MRIKRVQIENFRCLLKVDIEFDQITTLLGPTGTGKSTVLRALDWFFNGEKSVSISSDDIHTSLAGLPISVEVEFTDLTAADRDALGRYAAPDSDRFTLWRIWNEGEDKITGRALTFPPFETVRTAGAAMAKRRAYNELRESRPELELPQAGNEPAVIEAMVVWEQSHREELVETSTEATHFFGFAGQSKLAELIDFVFIAADLRGYEEAGDGKSTVLGRILDHAIDRTAAGDRLGEIEETAQAERAAAYQEVYEAPLQQISKALSAELHQFTAGRTVQIAPLVQPPKTARTTFEVSIQDGAASTSVARQGHGFQRALIIATLKFLAEQRREGADSRTLCLAVEEPELFQHPPQARTFARVLRTLTDSTGGTTQVMYATHSPVFVEARSYHEIRCLGREFIDGHPSTRVWQVSEAELCEMLGSYVDEDKVKSRAGSVYTNALAEAFFAHAALLVEGTTDAALLEGAAERLGINLGAEGIIAIDANGKGNLLLYRALLRALGVPCYVLFDGDADEQDRQEARYAGMTEPQRKAKVAAAVEKASRENAQLLSFLGAPPIAWPPTASVFKEDHAMFVDDLELFAAGNWPSWTARRQALIDSGDGIGGKNADTYREAARTAEREPPFEIVTVLEYVRAMARGVCAPR